MNSKLTSGLLRAVCLLSISLLAACATTGSAERTNPTLIEREEIQAAPATDAYQLILSTRPTWLRQRGGRTATVTETENGAMLGGTGIIIYLDGTRVGEVGELTSISTTGLTSVRRLSPSEATQRFGTGHPQGAILLSREP